MNQFLNHIGKKFNNLLGELENGRLSPDVAVEVNTFLEEISQRTDEPKEAIKAGHLPVPGDGGEWAKPPAALKAHFESYKKNSPFQSIFGRKGLLQGQSRIQYRRLFKICRRSQSLGLILKNL
jgi:hypothetical protein